MDNNLFFEFIRNNQINVMNFTEEDAIKYLKTLIQVPNLLNDSLFPLIDYELIFYIENRFSGQNEIKYLLDEFKYMVTNNYLYRKQYLTRILPKEQLDSNLQFQGLRNK